MGLKLIDYAMGLAVAVVWGMGFVFAKAAIAHFPPILLMSFRFAVTALVLLWFVRAPIGLLARLFGIAMAATAIPYSLTFTGVKSLDASVAVLVIQLEVPFIVLLGAVFLNEAPGLRKWLGVAAAFAGVAIIAGEPRLGGAWVPLLLVIAGSFTWALGQAMIRSLRNIDGLTVTAWLAAFASPQLLVMSLLFEAGHAEAIASAGWLVWSAVVYLGVVMTALGYGLWNTLIRRHPISLVAPFLLLMPVFSVVGAVVFLGEALSAPVVIGGAIVLAGVAFLLVERPRAAGK